jgi:phosphoribosylaminoimidazole-succinocarboxamide synthase
MNAHDATRKQEGAILTRMSEMWFGLTGNIVRNHFRSAEVPAVITNEKDRRELQGRVMVVDKAEALPVEAIARGLPEPRRW